VSRSMADGGSGVTADRSRCSRRCARHRPV
jgi:hypothetical protein